ncbi:hypothetical protein WJX81_002755 [Elliptochloris bilobata]|uniref:WD repeat-containing protein 55 n=1 Tax=Elliptochloris bilobata TaxID=381761 RepID=A0AAW1REA9_9CHLO
MAHTESCRSLRFTPDGALLLTASADMSLLAVDVQTGKAAARRSAAHAAPINRVLPLSERAVASGDDEGAVHLWDTRQADATARLEVHSDYVADMALAAGEQCLLAVSGDGTLSVTDLRTGKVRARSEADADDELLSVVAAKGGRKLVVGSGAGVLNLFSWGHFEDCSDRFPGHPSSVDAMVAFDADTVLTGSADGLIRIIGILPNAMLGLVGEHAQDPVERLALSADCLRLASVAHDSTLRLWDLGFLREDDADSGDEAAQAPEAANGTHVGGQGPTSTSGRRAAEAASAAASCAVQGSRPWIAEDARNASESGSDAEPALPKKRRKERKKGGKIPKRDTSGSKAFFKDLL